MATWIEAPDVSIPAELLELVGGREIVAQALVRRGLTDVDAARAFLDPAHYTPTQPCELPGVTTAADRLEEAIQRQELVCVWGDFDVDGQTATTVLVSALQELGGRVIYHIPVRAEESHGVNLHILQSILEQQTVNLLLTCDTGISAHEAVEYATGKGTEVIITDHHELPASLPAACAIINPHFLPEDHPLRALPGVGVAFKLVQELFTRTGREQDCDSYLDLVALGIVADVARQTGEARYLLQRGLLALREPQRLGMQVIMELAELSPTWLSEEHIGFFLGPRLNAVGRLADANAVVELFTTRDLGRARLLAQQMEGLNGRRQLLTNQVYHGALAQIEKEPELLDAAALVLAHPSWPAGVIGIVASRLVERFHKPAVLISTSPGGPGRGSARSVEGVNITETIATQQEMLLGFGGHAMAAGFSIDPQRIVDFRRGLSTAMAKQGVLPPPSIIIDKALPLADLSLELVKDIEQLSPFGPGNPPLTLASHGVKLISHAQVGRNQEHLLLTVEGEQGAVCKVIWWQGADYFNTSELPDGLFDLAYAVRTTTFRGQRDIQVEWIDFHQDAEVLEIKVERLSRELLDFRQETQPLARLNELATSGEVQVWAEGEALVRLSVENKSRSSGIILHRRDQLAPGRTLVIWTTPPGRSELEAALAKALPEQVAMFAIDPQLDSLPVFIKRLAGLVKYGIQENKGKLDFVRLAGAMAHREITVRKGVEWLAHQGYIEIVEDNVGEMIIHLMDSKEKGMPDRHAEMAQTRCELMALLEETAAFRSYYARVNPETLFDFK